MQERAEPECLSTQWILGVQFPGVLVGRHRVHLLSGRSASVASLDASAAACGVPISVVTPSPAVHGFRKPSGPALVGLGIQLCPRLGLSSLCYLPQREGRQGDRQVGTSVWSEEG